jgi:N-methylhydantoinase B/oxoprolinase/acetone carboxylase alpha subunit
MMFSGGGEGANLRSDGKSGLLWPTSAANTSIEMFEIRIPMLVLEKRRPRPDARWAGLAPTLP